MGKLELKISVTDTFLFKEILGILIEMNHDGTLPPKHQERLYELAGKEYDLRLPPKIGGAKMETKEILKKELKLLAEWSEIAVDATDITNLAHAMVAVAGALQEAERKKEQPQENE